MTDTFTVSADYIRKFEELREQNAKLRAVNKLRAALEEIAKIDADGVGWAAIARKALGD